MKPESDPAPAVDGTRRLADLLQGQLQAKGLSQRELARILARRESTVSLWVTGRQSPRLRDAGALQSLAAFLAMRPADLRQLLQLEKQAAAAPRPTEAVVLRSDTDFEQALAVHPSILGHAGGLVPASLADALVDRGYRVDARALHRFLRTRDLEGLSAAARHQAAVEAFSAPIADRDLGDRLRSAFAADEWLRAAIRATCAGLNASFVRNRDEIDERDLGRVLHEGLRTARQPVTENLARALLVALLDLRLVGRSGGHRYRRLWDVSADYVLNRLLGVATLVEGLDFLLDGGWLVPATSGLTAIVKGKAGAGKTTFALHVAAGLASQGHFAVYLTAEEPIGLLVERLSFIGYTRASEDHGPVRVLTKGAQACTLILAGRLDSSAILDHIERSKRMDPTRGVLVISALPSRRLLGSFDRGTLHELDRLVAHAAAPGASGTDPSGPPPRAVTPCWVLDSLDAVVGSETPGRRAYEDLAAFGRRHRSIGILLSEEHDPRSSAGLRDYLTDLVIRLGSRERERGFNERTIEIEKCRTQTHRRGQHMFSIQTQRGITIYPSVQAVLSVWRKRVTPPPSADQEPWSLDGLDFGALLKSDLVKGSTMLLTGAPATHKFAVGLSFLAAGLESQPGSHVLLISLREDEAAVERIARTYAGQLRDLFQPRGAAIAMSERLHILHLRPDYYTAERFLHWVRRTLSQLAQAKQPVVRVVFNSLAQLRNNSPMYEHEKLFREALVELFRKEGLTSLFIDVGGKESQEIENVFDILLFTERRSVNGSDRVWLKVGHSGPCTADRAARQLDRVEGAEGARLVLRAPGADALRPAPAKSRGVRSGSSRGR
jgi:KaiC/GvpD/RAD55 family RecA-like ATPase/transcriptional regulator with XRE-family HTH domain